MSRYFTDDRRNKKVDRRRNGEHKKGGGERQRMIEVWEDTKRLSLSLSLSLSLNLNLNLGFKEEKEKKETVKFTRLLTEFEFADSKPQKFDQTNVCVRNVDTLVMAECLVALGMNPMVLNMASYFKPGGGVRSGARAQEEHLFRCTDAHVFLSEEELYPLGTEEFLYTPCVTVLKNELYEVLPAKDRFSVGMMSVAAIRRPRVTIPNKLANPRCRFEKEHDVELTKQKIEAMLQTAAFYKHDSVVLGALGCGAYFNPAHHVAELFRDILPKYEGCFKTIAFAVLSTTDCNFDVFSKYIGQDASIVAAAETSNSKTVDADSKFTPKRSQQKATAAADAPATFFYSN